MDFLTILTYVEGAVETVALLAALVFATRAMKAKKDQAEKKRHLTKAALFLIVYLALNMVRRYVLGA